MSDGPDDSRISGEERHFIAQQPVDFGDPESVRRWLQTIASQIARDEDFNVDGLVVPGEDPSDPGDGGGPLPGGPGGGPVPVSYRFDINPCPGKHYVGPGAAG